VFRSGASVLGPFLGATKPDGAIDTRAFRKNQDSNLAGTNRLKALCDGVFAIIITLLVLEIHRPSAARGELGKNS
jgi:transmembrane protein TMEM174 (potassium channel)